MTDKKKKVWHCLDCGNPSEHYRYEFFKPAKPKCSACGGTLENMRHEWKPSGRDGYARHTKKMAKKPQPAKLTFAEIKRRNDAKTTGEGN